MSILICYCEELKHCLKKGFIFTPNKRKNVKDLSGKQQKQYVVFCRGSDFFTNSLF